MKLLRCRVKSGCLFFIIMLVRVIAPLSAQVPVELTAEERAYLIELGSIRICVDPDWAPYEWLDESGSYRGIAADLIFLMAGRLDLPIEIIPTDDWKESLETVRSGKAHLLAFLNQTPERDAWLLFTDPYFTDPNVFITREEHDFIFDPARLSGETIVFPAGTSMEEHVRNLYPNLTVITTETEGEALQMISGRLADMTLRSLTMAAYTIRNEGLFNLKIAGQLPELENNLRMGVSREYELLRGIMNKGVAVITPEDVQAAINTYISIEARTGVDYFLLIRIILVFLLLAGLSLFWNIRLKRLNRELKAREAEIFHMAQHDGLTDLPNRALFSSLLNQAMTLSRRNRTALALFFVDLDRFKPVNDTYGHAAGDLILQETARRLLGAVRTSDGAGRIGGDEFVLFIQNIHDQDDARVVADKIRLSLEAPFEYEGKPLYLSAAVGYALFPLEAEDEESLFQKADTAMYADKKGGSR